MCIVPSRSFACAVVVLGLSCPVGLAGEARASEVQELAMADGAARRRVAIAIQIAAEGGPRDASAEAAVRAGVVEALPNAELVDQSDVYAALMSPAFLDGADDVASALPDATRADIALGSANCRETAKYGNPASFDAQSSMCRRGLVDVLWRRHVSRLGVDEVILVWGKDDTPPAALRSLLPPAAAGRGFFLSVHRGAAGIGEGRQAQGRRISDPRGFVAAALQELARGGGMTWIGWSKDIPEIPAAPTPPPSFEELLARLDRAATKGGGAPVEPRVMRARSWCRGPLPSTIILAPDGPFTRLVAARYERALADASVRWEMQPRARSVVDPRSAEAPATGTLSATLSPRTVPTGEPGAIGFPERAFLKIALANLDRPASGFLAEGSFDDAEEAAAAVVSAVLDALCLR